MWLNFAWLLKFPRFLQTVLQLSFRWKVPGFRGSRFPRFLSVSLVYKPAETKITESWWLCRYSRLLCISFKSVDGLKFPPSFFLWRARSCYRLYLERASQTIPRKSTENYLCKHAGAPEEAYWALSHRFQKYWFQRKFCIRRCDSRKMKKGALCKADADLEIIRHSKLHAGELPDTLNNSRPWQRSAECTLQHVRRVTYIWTLTSVVLKRMLVFQSQHFLKNESARDVYRNRSPPSQTGQISIGLR